MIIKNSKKIKLMNNRVFSLIILLAVFGIFFISSDRMTGKVISGEVNDSKIIIDEFDVADSKENLSISIKDIKKKGNILDIVYEFNGLDYVGDGISVDLWIVDSDGYEIKKISDVFLLSKDTVVRNVAVELPEGIFGSYNIKLALTSDPEKFISQNVIIGKSYPTGLTILDEPRNKMIGYGIFILVILAGIFFIVKNYWSSNNYFDEEERGRKR